MEMTPSTILRKHGVSYDEVTPYYISCHNNCRHPIQTTVPEQSHYIAYPVEDMTVMYHRSRCCPSSK